MASSSLIMRLVSASVSVAGRAGKIIRDVMSKGNLGIVEKGKNDLQTEADRSAQKCIVASLSRQFPDIIIIGEESLDSNESVNEEWIEPSLSQEVLKHQCPKELQSVTEKDVVVWVDPLDGTSEYTEGLLDHVTVLIGVAVHGKAVGGVIHQPYYNYQAGPGALLGRTIWGIVGIGAYGLDRSFPIEGKRIVTTTRSHSDGIVKTTVEAMQPDEVIKVGGAGHKVLLLIEGKAHAYVFASPGCKKWDTCAPEAILHAVGGKLTDMHGNSVHYQKDVKHKNSGGVLATAVASQHEWFLEKVPKTVLNILNP